MIPLLLLSLTGCWKPFDELTTLSTAEVPYTVESLAATDAVITSFDSDIMCPDGTPARIFVVYREQSAQADGVALIFHSGAFDYVLDPPAEDPLDGDTWYLESRLNRTWSVSKIWETLGMLNPAQIDADEVNLGTLGAALADANFVQVYPGNCWGDLWHDEVGVTSNDPTEGFDRDGFSLAWQSVRLVMETNYAADRGFQVPVSFSGAGLYLIGLGEGARAVNELLLQSEMPPVSGVLLDSPMDNLQPYLADPITFEGEVTGLNRIFYDVGDDLSPWSLSALDENDLPTRMAYVWSDQDPQLPPGVASQAADALEASGTGWIYNTGTDTHVQTNGNAILATAAVNYLLNGTIPSLDE